MVHLYDKYGEGGGMLSKKAFAQVINVPPCSLHTAVGCFLICYCVTFLSSHVLLLLRVLPRPWGEHLTLRSRRLGQGSLHCGLMGVTDMAGTRAGLKRKETL